MLKRKKFSKRAGVSDDMKALVLKMYVVEMRGISFIAGKLYLSEDKLVEFFKREGVYRSKIAKEIK